MSQTVSMEVFLLSLLAFAFLCYAEASTQCAQLQFQCSNGACTSILNVCDMGNDCGDYSDEHVCDLSHCHPLAFQCMNGHCISRRWVCNGANECGDNSDERYCYVNPGIELPPGFSRCPGGSRFIRSSWMCDGRRDCYQESEEDNCGTHAAKTSVYAAQMQLKSWLVKRRESGSRSEVHRIAVALHLADNTTFRPDNRTGDEIRYDLQMQLQHYHSRDKKMSSQELALYIHALLVSCMDARDFYGWDLVRELRRRVEAGGNYTNPFLILALCNAGDAMTPKDVERVTTAYDSNLRPFWTDVQALSSMALSCISSRGGVPVDERTLRNMLQELRKHQFSNGTVDNFLTTALVTQALFIHNSHQTDFDLDSAMRALIDGLGGSQSILDAYYALPVLHGKNLLNVSSSHCSKQAVAGGEAMQRALEASGETITVHYSVRIGDETNSGRTWELRMRANSTIYNAIETVVKIDKQKVKYHVVNQKPYVAALNGKQEDPEQEMYWFVYLKSRSTAWHPNIVEESPVDVKLQPNQEIILWYKRG